MTNNNRMRESAELIRELLRDFYKQKKQLKSHTKISIARIEVIEFLCLRGPQTLKAIADYRKVTAATMSRLVASLIEEGLVLRANSKKDHRSKIFLVTNKGRQLFKSTDEQDINLLLLNMKNLSDVEQDGIKKAVHLLRKVIISNH